MTTSFTQAQVEAMCAQCGLTREILHAALRKAGASALPKAQRDRWSTQRPTDQFCYRVTEAIYRAGMMPEGFRPMRKKDAEGSHWFFQHLTTGAICDPTADQFLPKGRENFEVPARYDYSGAEKKNYMPQLSNGAKSVMRVLGWAPSVAR